MNREQQYNEMVKRVKEVADYAIKTGASTRQISAYFTENRFPISNATVCDYLNKKLPQIDGERYRLVKAVIEKNTPKTITSIEVKKRIYQAVFLLLQGLTIPQVVEKMNKQEEFSMKITFDIIYDDLTKRLPKIENDSSIIEKVQSCLQRNRLSTLNNQGKNGPNLLARTQPRNEQGMFTTEQKKR